eukprot:11182574-Alexandrium_andersonii.AAC.1
MQTQQSAAQASVRESHVAVHGDAEGTAGGISGCSRDGVRKQRQAGARGTSAKHLQEAYLSLIHI